MLIMSRRGKSALSAGEVKRIAKVAIPEYMSMFDAWRTSPSGSATIYGDSVNQFDARPLLIV